MKKNEKKNGGYYLELLPSEIQSKIVANLSVLHPNAVAEEITRIKGEEYINLADMIASLFDWDKTNEGRKYWEGVIDKKYDGKDFDESVSELYDLRLSKITDTLSDKLNELLSDVFGSQILKYTKQIDDINENPNAYKSGKEYIAELSESEQSNFFANIESIGRNVDEYLKNKYHSYGDFIGGAFPFFTTKEGVKYWSEIRSRNISEQDLNEVLSELNIRKSE